jgi:hypothetical protein
LEKIVGLNRIDRIEGLQQETASRTINMYNIGQLSNVLALERGGLNFPAFFL